MGEVAFVNRSKNLGDDVVAFGAAACARQAEEAAEAWGIKPIPVQVYRNGEGVLPDECWVFTIVDTIDMTGALGYHDDWAGTIYGQILAQGDATTITMSHEVLETLVDRTCNQWRYMRDGRRIALEVCDPVEGDTYLETVTLFGETRGVQVSNYVFPAWFQDGATGPYDRMRRVTKPFLSTPGGYQIVSDKDGTVSNVFADREPARMKDKLANPISRTMRRSRR